MTALWILIGFSVVLASFAGAAYCWANQSGQYDDVESPGVRIVFEDFDKENQLKETLLCKPAKD